MAVPTDAELEILQVLWQHGELAPQEMEDHISRPITNATIRSTLMVLLEKGHVQRRKVSRSYVYRATTPQKNAFQRLVEKMKRTFADGSTVGLIAQLIETEDLSDEDLKELQRLARLKAAQKSTQKKKAKS